MQMAIARQRRGPGFDVRITRALSHGALQKGMRICRRLWTKVTLRVDFTQFVGGTDASRYTTSYLLSACCGLCSLPYYRLRVGLDFALTVQVPSALDLIPIAPPLRRPRQLALTGEPTGKVLLLSQLYPPDVGGSAVLLHEGYSRLGGNALTVVADRRNHRSGVTSAGAPLVAAPIETTRWGLFDPRAAAHHIALALRLRRLASPSTVIHCARALPEGVAAWVASFAGGPRYVCWTHGEDVTSALTSRELTLVMRRVHARASAVVANSANTQRLLENSGVPSSKIHTVYPGVDAERFTPDVDGSEIRAHVAPGADLVLLSVGRLQRRKGHDTALLAVAAVKAEYPRLRYVIVGDGEERTRLETMVHELNLTDRVTFAGEVSAAVLPEYYAACDIFLLPNRIERGDIEGFGIVFLEAAAAGRPVIAGNSGGVTEAVAQGETGLLVGGTDVEELAETIRRLASDPALRQSFGRAGRERVMRAFTWKATAERIRAVHETVLALD
jgi:phosphatidylinositol alpha-1,6-mannosyltransferase